MNPTHVFCGTVLDMANNSLRAKHIRAAQNKLASQAVNSVVTLSRIARDPDAPYSDRIRAAEAILNRVGLRPDSSDSADSGPRVAVQIVTPALGPKELRVIEADPQEQMRRLLERKDGAPL